MKNKKLFSILTLVCFMLTLMPVAAFAAVDVQTSYAYTVKANPSVTVGDKVAVNFAVRGETTTNLYVWFQEKGTDVPSTATQVYAVSGNEILAQDLGNGIFLVKDAYTEAVTNFSFKRAGSYVLYAATVNPLTMEGKTIAEQLANSADYKIRTLASSSEVTVASENVAYDDYRANISYSADGVASTNPDDAHNGLTGLVNGNKATALVIDVNAVDTATVAVKLYNKISDQKILAGKTINISTNSSNVTVSKTSVTTNALGKIEFDVTGVAAGEYIIYLTCGGFDLQIPVKVGATDAAYIETVKEPSAPLNVGADSLKGKVEFEITDINGNEKSGTLGQKAFTSNTDPDKNYVKFISKPEASKLNNVDLYLVYDAEKGYYIALNGGKTFDSEGTYVMQVALDNGNSAKATVEIKEFKTPVELKITYKQEAVELAGKAVVDDLVYVDANGVEKDATDAKLAASGYAISAFYPEAQSTIAKGTIFVKSDEKYVGSEIKVTAVSERYNLVANTTVKVTADAAELAFASKTAEVNVNNKIDVQIVDANGNKVAPTNVVKSEISYVVLDKPEGAKVAVTTVKSTDLADKGVFTMSLTSDKIGNVAVQAIAKLTIEAKNDNGATTGANVQVVKYYTGTQIFAVGNGSVGDVVVMSIGSNEIIVNDAKATIDAAPIVQNDRTYVPFRALAEAFGAEVAYDEATQAVTAELNGVTVVMTIGSATYTVNGAEKTMDVAPFINGSRTMVPVRFVAEAFGIKVIPTYDENGATADILFNL